MIGQQLSHYSILAKLGEGGMGTVYLAEDLDLKRSVALKVLPSDFAGDPERLARFRREAEALAAISHPNIVTVFSIEQVGELHILTMERIEGSRLDELVPEGGMPVDQLLEVAIALSNALAAAHEKGITHRDLKPENLMLTEDGRLKVLDFGLAKLAHDGASRASTPGGRSLLTREEIIIGTAPYMSPEQIECGEIDGRSDLFSFGVVVYELATGQRPFSGKSAAAVMAAILDKEPRPVHELRRDLPRGLDGILARCMQKDPANRYQTAGEVQADLQAVRESALSRTSWHPARWPAVVRWVAATVVVILAGLSVWQGFFRVPAADTSPGIVVLDFENSGATEDVHLTVGLRSHIVSQLKRAIDLKVLAPRNVRPFSEMSAAQIGEKLGVGYLLYGRVLWEGAAKDEGRKVLITPSLVRIRDGDNLGMQPFVRVIRDIDDVLKVQRDIANEVIDLLGVELAPAARMAIDARPTNNLKSYNLYLRGLYYHGKRNKAAFEEARRCFGDAVKLDPGFALGYTGLASIPSALSWYCLVRPRDVHAQESDFVQKALHADPELPEAWAHNALALSGSGTSEAAERAYRQAIRLGKKYPRGYANGHHWFGNFLSSRNRHGEALEQALEAQRLDPVSPIITTHVGLRHYFAGRYEQAIEEYDDALKLDAEFIPAHWHRSWACAAVHEFDQAIHNAERARELSPENNLYIVNLAWTYAMKGAFSNGGERDRARELLDQLSELEKTQYVSGYHLAAVFAALGDTDEAVRRLQQAYDDLDNWFPFLRVDPRMTPLREDPRFAEMIRRLGF